MEKKGGAWKIVGIIFLVLIILILAVGIYLWNFYTFKTVRMCLGEPTSVGISCTKGLECQQLAGKAQMEKKIEDMPQFVKDEFGRLLDEAIYCDNTCRVKEFRGINLDTKEIEDLDSCYPNEKEFLVKIGAREGWELWKYFKTH